MNTVCRQREDLKGYGIPVLVNGKDKYMELDRWMFCKQPDSLDDAEYNVEIEWNGETIYANSIDLNFDEFNIDRWYDKL